MEKQKIIRFELKQLLKEKGMTYEEFGQRCNPPMEKQAVYNLTKREGVSFSMLERIVNALNLSEEELSRLIKIYSV
ncbi:helix-turn-helix transcriptional regulator [Salipaludibacillus sp. CUR1]|uniref:helix-turn-helix domain-containing protein n=1 Tax=Salipaludibacillus sp. CUR1 TaxID=2820003 RepID=UPI001E60EF18|nr:helix-turn-helix transcriptional regulator [Salipaludibacillus sp. CUR1]MCE7792301.1 helix-turn-helix transcriptional regulator [Salipaludibacillus sp. CUR1]